jgi:hypothetical protein
MCKCFNLQKELKGTRKQADWDKVRRQINGGEAWAGLGSESDSGGKSVSESNLNCTKWGKVKLISIEQ